MKYRIVHRTLPAVLGLCLTVIAGCGVKIPTPGVYKLDVQQGNVINAEMLARLEPGMEKRKVRFLLGTPLVIDTFDPDRWDYVYSFQEGGGERVQRKVTVIFEDDRLVKLEGDIQPSEFAEAPKVKQEQVVTVPDQSPDSFLSGFGNWFGEDERMPLERKPTDDDDLDVEKGFFDGLFDGNNTDPAPAGNKHQDDSASEAEDTAAPVSPDVTDPEPPAPADEADAEAASADDEIQEQADPSGTGEDEDSVGFFERLSDKFGLEAPPRSGRKERR